MWGVPKHPMRPARQVRLKESTIARRFFPGAKVARYGDSADLKTIEDE